MKQAPTRLLLLLIITGATGAALHASTVAYGFDGAGQSPTISAPGTTASDFMNWGICSSANGNPGGYCGTFDNFGTPGTNYMFFTVTPDAGLELNLLSFSFDEINPTSAGPTGFDIFTSADGFTTAILGGALSPSASSFTNHSVSLTGAEFQGLTGPLTVRISGYGGPPPTSTQGVWRLDNVTLNLTTSAATAPAPEPALWAPTAALLAAMLAVARRRSC